MKISLSLSKSVPTNPILIFQASNINFQITCRVLLKGYKINTANVSACDLHALQVTGQGGGSATHLSQPHHSYI